MSKKFKFKLDGMEFNLPNKHLRAKDWYGNDIKPEISINQSAASNLLKQYVKKKFPNVTVSVSSSSFSMGNSCDVYISDEVGNPVDKSIIEDVKSWGDQFVYGKFNGMIDMYEYNEGTKTTDNNTPLKYFPSYVFCNNSPKWGSVEYWLSEYNKWLENTGTDEWLQYDSMVQKAGGWLNYNKTYMTDKEFKKVEKEYNVGKFVNI